MNKSYNYPIKYAVLEVKEKGGWTVGYENITQGFIVSKCFVIETNVIYRSNGENKVVHKVVFPYEDFSNFKQSLSNGEHSVGIANSIYFDCYGNPYPSHVVDSLYDTYEDAKKEANDKNEDFKANLLSHLSVTNPSFEFQYEFSRREFEQVLLLCNLFEQLISNKTDTLEISKENNNSSIKILKPIRKK